MVDTLRLVIADCSWGCLMGLWWLMPNGIGSGLSPLDP